MEVEVKSRCPQDLTSVKEAGQRAFHKDLGRLIQRVARAGSKRISPNNMFEVQT